MKKILILAFFCSFFTCDLRAKEATPENVVLQLAPGEQNEQPITLFDQVKTVLEVGDYFDKNYPDTFIEEDLSDDIRQFFPSLSPQEVYDREETVRDGVKFYRYFKTVYENIKSKFLAPEAPPLMVDEKDYDDYVPAPYIEADGESAVVITDIKKVLSYGNDYRDYEAYKARFERERQKTIPKTELGKLSHILSTLEWRKLPFYGIFYTNPVIGTLGIGEREKDDQLKGLQSSLMAATTTVNDSQEIRGVLQIIIPEGYAIPAYPYQKFDKPQVKFSGSENLKEAVTFWPVPYRMRSEDEFDLIAYRNKLVIPILYKLDDIQKPLKLKAEITYAICDESRNCRVVNMAPTLNLEVGNGYQSSVSNFITQHFNYLPTTESKELVINKIIADDEAHNLRILMTNHGTVAKPDIFISTSDNIRFGRPRIAIDGKKMIARLDVLDSNAKLADREVEATVVINDYSAIRSRYEVSTAGLFDFSVDKLSISLIWLAILGGFILNFMPCVFPVLSLKLLSVTRFGAQRETTLKKSFALTILGIFSAFLILAVLLAVIKALGHSIGWGMQFQNPVFIVVMLFVIVLFLAQIKGFYTLNTPQWLNRLAFRNTHPDNLLHFLTGVLVVVMSTPCTAPYLGTTIGFALAGTTIDIFVILLAVALGLSLPYIFVLFIPDVTVFIPKPGAWMKKLSFFMSAMLLLTIIWLFSVLWAQTEAWTCIRLAVYLTIFFLVIWFRHLLLNQVEIREIDVEVRAIVLKLIGYGFMALALIIAAISIWDIRQSFYEQRRIEVLDKSSTINFAEISKEVRAGNIVIVNVGADWCLTCTYNDNLVFGNIAVKDLIERYKIKIINVDWTNYNQEILNFMGRFGRKGVPFYILFSPNIPEGMVLPEIMTEKDLREIIQNVAG